MNRNELLNLKRRIIALSLAGSCLIGLTGCSRNSGNSNELADDTNIINDNYENKVQFLCIYEDKAIIIEPLNYFYHRYGSNYEIILDDDGYNDMLLPMSQYICFKRNSVITAEDYVALVCGPDFPIEYIRSEDYNKSR